MQKPEKVIETLAHGYSSESPIISHRVGLHNTCQKGVPEIYHCCKNCRNYHNSPCRCEYFCDQNFIFLIDASLFFISISGPTCGRLSLLSEGAPTSYVLCERYLHTNQSVSSCLANRLLRIVYEGIYLITWLIHYVGHNDSESIYILHIFCPYQKMNHLISFPLGFPQL